jgi:hypothetical protein
LEQQRASEFISDSGHNSSIFAEYSRNKYELEFYDHLANPVKPMITSDCMGNYMFLPDHNFCHFNIALSSSSEHFPEEKVIMIDDQDLNLREQEGDQSSSIETIMAEQEFSVDQHFSDLGFKDPVAVFMELYFSESLKVSYFFSSPMFSGEYDFRKEFLLQLLLFRHQRLINDRDKVALVLKLLEWLLWKSTFT